MKIICIGSNIESQIALEYLVDASCDILALITRPSGKVGAVSDYTDLHPFCKQHNITTIDTVDVNCDETIQMIKELDADYLFTLGWSQIFSGGLINCFKKGIIGSHPTKLPEGRGRAPVPWTILQNKKSSAVSFFFIDEGVDTGEIILQRGFSIPENCYANDLYSIIAKELGIGFVNIYNLLKSNSPLSIIPQSSTEVTHTAKRTKLDGVIDFNKNSKEIDLLIRAVSYPYPGAYSYYNYQRIYFHKCEMISVNDYFGLNGQILQIEENRIRVKLKDGSIWLSEMRSEDGSLLSGSFFKIHKTLGLRIEEEILKIREALNLKI